MKKKILIDTDVVINFLKGVNKAAKYIKSHSGEDGIFQKPIKDISLGNLLVSLFQTAQQFEMEVQPQLVLLQKTLLNIEGLGFGDRTIPAVT